MPICRRAEPVERDGLGIFPAKELTAGVGDRQHRSGDAGGNTFDRLSSCPPSAVPRSEAVRITDAGQTVARQIDITCSHHPTIPHIVLSASRHTRRRPPGCHHGRTGNPRRISGTSSRCGPTRMVMAVTPCRGSPAGRSRSPIGWLGLRRPGVDKKQPYRGFGCCSFAF